MAFTVVIPARYQSTRFPGKPLVDILGKPMIQHVVERAQEAGASAVIVATDDQRIASVASKFADVVMTDAAHTSGTERIAEVVRSRQIPDDTIVVNVQGDEPFVPAGNIQQVAANLASSKTWQMATLCTEIHTAAEVLNPNVVKVVASASGRAMYFSRSVIPFARDTMMAQPVSVDPTLYRRHIGLYAYRAQYIKQYVSYAPSALEHIESLEQLRALWNDDAIHVELAKFPPPVGIDTPEDLVALLATLSAR
ncbi:3-deoxy-manno-octulosonate cytidylyltransferase [Aestuariibacter sp. GS-14]|uniref:3-deoxy-manno-octulosonate cytidylyltransferase n=1 Tax=Aestuariibacter sp. GS-14 TaxID=2590670 RepID=UPI00112A707F|nr:3-deoxy-manno-octulosonate cytidylyltransferase [Aestuariibacter sp. GS-14]TPV61051.1 3-deoxy-manno-octulosonate cytidylyltransferase [Aestuariibacter sp. GS-14]